MTDARIGVALKTLGCKVNRVESDDIAADLLGRGVELVGEDDAAAVIINTCTVTGEADAKARKAVRHALGAAGHPVVVVTGCLAALDRGAIEALGERVVVEPDKARVATKVLEALGRERRNAPASRRERPDQGFRTRAMLKVEDGCDAFCSYCIVPYARGLPRSANFESIVVRAASLVANGTREIVLTGINLGRYWDADRDLADVVRAVASTGIDRVRLSSIEPADLTERLLNTLAGLDAVCHHLHVPLQSGSDIVLKRMARTYDTAAFAERIAAARAALPGLAVTTDVIAGFHGETAADAEETVAFCREMGFSKLHVFRYSERAGTRAAAMDGRVPIEVRRARAEVLRALDARLQRTFAESHVGETVEVLVERLGRPAAGVGKAAGTARDYLKVRIAEADCLAVGALVNARVTDASVVPVSAVTIGPVRTDLVSVEGTKAAP